MMVRRTATKDSKRSVYQMALGSKRMVKVAKIADDVQCSIATVNNVLKEAKQNGNNEKA